MPRSQLDSCATPAKFFRNVAAQNEPLREQLNDNADVYDQLARLVEADPLGTLDIDGVLPKARCGKAATDAERAGDPPASRGTVCKEWRAGNDEPLRGKTDADHFGVDLSGRRRRRSSRPHVRRWGRN